MRWVLLVHMGSQRRLRKITTPEAFIRFTEICVRVQTRAEEDFVARLKTSASKFFIKSASAVDIAPHLESESSTIQQSLNFLPKSRLDVRVIGHRLRLRNARTDEHSSGRTSLRITS